jgi:hypothetical protein
MTRTTDADERAEYVTEKINSALDSYDVTAEFDGAGIIGSGEDAYIHATVTFDPQTTAEDVAGVRRALPIVFDKEIDFRGSETLALKIQSDL